MILEKQFEQLVGSREPKPELISNSDGTHAVKVPGLRIPKGWNRDQVSVAFVVPVGYPLASPDCFWAEPGIALEHGGVPQNTGQNPGPGIEAGWLWFSWHVQPGNWNPNASNLGTYVNIIRRRFADPR